MAGPTHQAMPRIGDRVDRYEVCGEIDSGGMSVIYAVKRVGGVGGWSKLLAMKVILPNLARQERFSRMFMDEARILSIIQHPNVVQVHDVGETDTGLLFMVMELLRGRSLARLIREAVKTDGTLDRAVILGILADAADGLNAAHDTRMADGSPAKIVHRDISPQNIHVGFDGSVRVVDFGIAAAEGRQTDTRTGELKGKLSYIAPEQVLRHSMDRRVDIWSLGVVAWEVLAGRRLFTGDNEIETLRNVDAMDVPPIAQIAKGLPIRTSDTIMRCLQRDPRHRPASAAIVAAAFREGARSAEADGEDPLDDRRAYLHRLLGTEMVIENERLAAAVRQGPPPPVRGISPEEELSDPFRLAVIDDTRTQAPPTRAARWRFFAAGGAAAVALFAGLGTFALIRGDDAPDSPAREHATHREDRPDPVGAPPAVAPVSHETPAPPRPAPPPTTPTTPPAESRTVQIVLDPRIRSVRVDGRTIEERPVRIVLEGQPVVVEATGADGERVRRVIDADAPDRVALQLPRSGPPTKSGGNSPLLASPYSKGSH